MVHPPLAAHSWYVSPNVEGPAGLGTLASPWSLKHAGAGANGAIGPGDVVLLRGGLYRDVNGYDVTVSGAPGHPITFRAYRKELPVIDGSITTLLPGADSPWEPVEIRAGHHVYRSSVALDHRTTSYGGLIALGGALFSLAPHKDIASLQNDNHLSDPAGAHYLGPGFAFEPDSKRMYIRLDNSTPAAQRDRLTVVQIADPDPNGHQIHIGPSDRYGLWVKGSHLRFMNIRFRAHYGCWVIPDPATDLEFHDCVGEPHRFVARLGAATNVKILGGLYNGHMHSPEWWVAYSDIKGVGEPAKGVRKAAFDLGGTADVELGPSKAGQRMIIRQFFDGILHDAPLSNIKVHGIWFDEIWDDAWQQVPNITNVEYHDNVHFGAGPSRQGLTVPRTSDGSVYIYDNVIDTTIHPIFWNRGASAEPSLMESIVFNGHKRPLVFQPAFPWKLYHNTVYTGRIPGQVYPDPAQFGSNPTSCQARHEVYNNIFVVLDGRPLARDFYAASSLEIYDGNCLWSGGLWATSDGAYRLVHTHLDPADEQGVLARVPSVDALRSSTAYTISKSYYPPGWENSSIEVDPKLDASYIPQNPAVRTGAVDLSARRLPGATPYRPQRGAQLTAAFPPVELAPTPV